MNSEDSEENWLKGVLGLNIVKDALIPYLKQHYAKRAEDWNTGDNHLNHLLMGGNVKYRKKDGSGCIWEVNCSDCRPILTEIEKSHPRPARLTWANNMNKDDGCQDEFRLAKIYMPKENNGNEPSKNFDDLDALAFLEILRNDKSFEFGYAEILYLILFRNRLMHSSKNCIRMEELDDSFSYMKKLLEYDKFKEQKECVSAVKELDKLKERNMICEIDESNETWKMAIGLRERVKTDEEKVPSREALTQLLKEIQAKLKEEEENGEIYRSQLSRSEDTIRIKQYEEWCLKNENQRLANENSDLRRLTIELKEDVEKLIEHTPTLAGRIFKGGVTGTSIGLFGGQIGALLGGAAGGTVGGMSYFWDKLTK